MPLPHLLGLVSEPQLGFDQAYKAAVAIAYHSGRCAGILCLNGAVFLDLLEADEIPTRAMKQSFAYRALEWQLPPGLDIRMECRFCGVAEHQLWRHVHSCCPAAYLHLLRARAFLLLAVAIPGSTVTDDGELFDGQGRVML